MSNNLMPKIAEILEVKIGENVIIESVESNSPLEVKLTDNGLSIVSDLPSPYFYTLNMEEVTLSKWLCGKFRIKGTFPKNGDKAYAFSKGGLICGNRLPHIEEFVFDSSSQFHLLLKEKGLLHETLDEAIKCFEKDYNTFKEMQGEE